MLETEANKTVNISLQLDYYLLEELNTRADEYVKEWSYMVNLAIQRFLNDINTVKNLRD